MMYIVNALHRWLLSDSSIMSRLAATTFVALLLDNVIKLPEMVHNIINWCLWGGPVLWSIAIIVYTIQLFVWKGTELHGLLSKERGDEAGILHKRIGAVTVSLAFGSTAMLFWGNVTYGLFTEFYPYYFFTSIGITVVLVAAFLIRAYPELSGKKVVL